MMSRLEGRDVQGWGRRSLVAAMFLLSDMGRRGRSGTYHELEVYHLDSRSFRQPQIGEPGDLIGKTCVVEKYLPNKGRYKVIFEVSNEVGLVGPENLKCRDRTPNDCGYYISYKNGRTTRHDFASREECQAFVASLTEGEKSGDVDSEAEA